MSLKPPVGPNTPLGTGRVFYNVQSDFGARGDGTTDDTAAIQAANAAAAAVAGIVFFPGVSSNYRAASNLTPSAGVTWMGPATITLVDDGTTTSRTIFVTANNVTIRDLTITSTATSRTGSFGLIRANAAVGLRVLNCRLLVSPGTAIHLLNCSDFLIQGNYVNGPYADGIHMQRQSVRGRVLGNHITTTGDDAIGVMSYRDSGTYSYCEQITIQGNVIYNIGNGAGVGRGIAIYGARDVTVQGNTITNIDNAGIDIGTDISASAGDATPYVKAIVVQGNTLRNTGKNAGAGNKTGITAAKIRGLIIRGNHIDTTAAQGIVLSGIVKDAIVAENRIARPTGRGIIVQQTTSTDSRLLSELYTDEGETAPGTAVSANVAITANHVRKTSDGIAVFGTVGNNLDGVVVNGNITIEGTASGITCQYVQNAAITGNRVAGTGSTTGIKADSGQYISVTGNSVTGTTDSIRITTCPDSNIVGNLAQGGTISADAASAPSTVNGNQPGTIVSVGAGSTITLRGSENGVVQITGAATCTAITATRMTGRVVTLNFTGIVTMTDGGNLKLNGNFVTAADATLTLFCDGTNWYEIARCQP